ncbi:MAG: GTP-binding protein, partial [Candidatus Saccharibacteria bacterium]|nr:GTP-binding protein [Candidatus Saccharibacteria bacterium]
AIRQHGAMLTDIVVIVVAADDGVKPQTVEAINFAKNANAKVIVAINKIDREGADIPRTMADLAEHGLTPEEWGGDVTMVPISAKRGDNLEKLVELILLTAEMEELKADIEVPSEGLVIESHMETGKGSVVNLLVTEGELKNGEFIVAGSSWGKIRTMLDFRGRPRGKALPSSPVTVTGFKTLPQFGERFVEAKDEKSARKMALLNANASAQEEASSNVTSVDLLRMMTTADTAKVFNVVIKGDVLGSVTSVVDSLKMIDTDGEIVLNIVATGVGDVTENDVYMATGEQTVVYGFNVGVPVNISKMAAREGVEVKCYKVIYELLDDAKMRMEEMMEPEVVEEVVGKMEIQGVFRVEKTRLIAGGKVKSGRIMAGDLVRKDGVEIGEVESVQIEKNAVEKLAEGEIGGMAVKTVKKVEVKVGEKVEFFRREVRKKKL